MIILPLGLNNNANRKSYEIMKIKTKVSLILLAIIIAISIPSFFIIRNMKEQAFINNTRLIISMIQSDKGLTDRTIELYIEVWHNAVYKEGTYYTGEYYHKDFNEALQIVQRVLENNIRTIKENEESFVRMLKNIQHPPSRYSNIHKDLIRLYGLVSDFDSLAITPEGSLTSYSQKTSDLSSSIKSLSKEIGVQLPSN